MKETPNHEQFARHFLERQPLAPTYRQILVDGLEAAEAGTAIERLTRRDFAHDWIRIRGRDVGSQYDPSGKGLVALMTLVAYEMVERGVAEGHYRLTERGKVVARMILSAEKETQAHQSPGCRRSPADNHARN